MLGIDNNYAPVELQDGGTGGIDVGDPPGSGGASKGTGGHSTKPTGSGGAGAGGATTTGAGGDVVASAGATPGAEAGSCDPSGCSAAEKCCPTIAPTCLPQATIIGCGATSCDPCPAPPNDGVAVCTDGKCAVQCNDGFMLVGDACVATTSGSGGAPGTGGAKGTGGAAGSNACTTADHSNCPVCVFVGIANCCQNNHTCGCTWAPGAVCY